MRYKFRYKNSTFDFWQLSMFHMYGSIIGLCNIIFTVAMILLTFKMWDNASYFIRLLLLMACFLFPVFQPIGVYTRAKKQASMAKEIVMTFYDDKIHVETDGCGMNLKWEKIKKVSKKPNMIIIYSSATHGFVLTNQVLGKQREEFCHYVLSKVNE